MYLTSISLPVIAFSPEIVIEENNLSSIEFPMLSSVNGSFTIDTEDLISVSLPQLEYCAGNFILNSVSMTSLNVPMLDYVGGTINLEFVDAFLAINFPMLNFVGGSIMHASPYRSGVVSISYPVLSYVEYQIDIENNHELQMISMPLLNTVGGPFIIENNNATKMVDLSSLRNVCTKMTGANEVEQDIVYMLCPSLINNGLCSSYGNFTVTNFQLPTSGCSNRGTIPIGCK